MKCVAVVGMPVLLFLTISQMLYAGLYVYAIPGQAGKGSEKDYVQNVLGVKNVTVGEVGTPFRRIDFGQSNCMQYLKHEIMPMKKKAIIYATSQGVATAVNYCATGGKEIQGGIFESCMASGNSTMMRYATDLPGGKLLAKMPLVYYWLPYIAKVSYLFYKPWGVQPIKSVSKIKNRGPFILIHSLDDNRLSYDDARALYYGLKQNGNIVYLISKPGKQHINLVRKVNEKEDTLGGIDDQLQRHVQGILKKHGLLEGDDVPDVTDAELISYQPDVQDFQGTVYKKAYDDLLQKEELHTPSLQYYAAATAIGVGGVTLDLAWRVSYFMYGLLSRGKGIFPMEKGDWSFEWNFYRDNIEEEL